jgi:hypothetical protein
MGRPLAPGGAQYSAAFSPWLTRNLQTIQFIDDRANGSERCLTDGHGCLQSGDASRPNTMLLRIPFLRVWRHSSGNSNSRLIAVWTAPVGLQNPRTVMRAPRRRAPVTRIRSQRFQAKWKSLCRRSAVLSSNRGKTPAERPSARTAQRDRVHFGLRPTLSTTLVIELTSCAIMFANGAGPSPTGSMPSGARPTSFPVPS